MISSMGGFSTKRSVTGYRADVRDISSAAETGDGVTSVPAIVEGPDLQIALNGTYINALLKALDVPEVKFGFNQHTEPVLITAIGEDAFLHVVMPMMLD